MLKSQESQEARGADEGDGPAPQSMTGGISMQAESAAELSQVAGVVPSGQAQFQTLQQLPGAHTAAPVLSFSPEEIFKDAPTSKRVRFAIVFIVAVGVTCLNLAQLAVIKFLVGLKFSIMQRVIDIPGLGTLSGIAALVLCSMFAIFLCLGSIFYIDPNSAGSGAPENKGWLNGSNQNEDMWTWKTLFTRTFATTMSNCSGFPVGREGPTVTMGGNFAYCVTNHIAARYMEAKVNLSARTRSRSGTESLASERAGEDFLWRSAKIMDEERFYELKRFVCTIGGACGMSLIFDSPIGGIVYMLEEIGTAGWSVDLTFAAFGATVFCDMLTRIALSTIGLDIKSFVIFKVDLEPKTAKSWQWKDMPFFLVIALVLGPFAAFHTTACLKVATWRQTFLKRFKQPRGKLVEGMIFAAFCAILASVAGVAGTCTNKPDMNEDEILGLEFVRFTCAEDQYNPVASLILTTSEAAMKMLISRGELTTEAFDGQFFDVKSLLFAFLAYTTQNILLTGVPVPSGNFTGTMLIGGFFGRIVGNVVGTDGNGFLKGLGYAKPGVYAMMGSAAMLCGFKRMSMATVLFIAECGDDWNLIPPLAIVVFVSLFLCKRIRHEGFDEEQMARKGIHFIEEWPHKTMYGHVASELLDPIASKAVLPLQVSIAGLRKFLEETEATDVPIVRADGVCVGISARSRLEAVLKNTTAPSDPASIRSAPLIDESDAEADIQVAIANLMDPVPLTVLKDMPAPRVHKLFAKARFTVVCVISENGKFEGLITRSSMITTAKKLHDE